MRLYTWALAIAGMLGAGWLGYRQGQSSDGAATAAPSAPTSFASPNHVMALGRIQPAGGVVLLSGPAGDRIDALHVAEGDQVAEGQVLAELASTPQRQLELQAAEALLQEAEARAKAEEELAESRIRVAELSVAEAEAAELDIESQQAQVELARRNHELAAKDWERLRTVQTQRANLVTEQEAERQRILVDQAAAQLAAAESQLKKLIQTRARRLQAAHADLEAARAQRHHALAAIPTKSLAIQRDLARTRLEQSAIETPIDGTVLQVLAHPGETLTGAFCQIANLSEMVVVAEVYETEIKHVHPGQPVVVRSYAFEDPFDQQGLHGQVQRVARTIDSPGLKSLDPLAMVDRRVVEVTIVLDPTSAEQASRLCNLQVDVEIEAAESRPTDP